MEKFSFSISAKSHLIQGGHIFFYLILFLVIPGGFYYRFGASSLSFAFGSALLSFLLVFIPQVLIHCRYFYLNRNILFSLVGKNAKVVKGEDVVVFHVDDIEIVECFESYSKSVGSLKLLPSDYYSYARVVLKSGQCFVLTSLLISPLKQFLEVNKYPVSFRKNLFCWI